MAYKMAASIVEISLQDSILLKGYSHAAHCLFWAPWGHKVFGEYEAKAAILMQARFDGSKGFTGGMVDHTVNSPLDILEALNKELVEEINLDTKKHVVKAENYLISHVLHSTKLITHFYTLKMGIDEFKNMEKRALDAKDFGDEVFGLLRVPLYTMKNGKHGFPTFLRNVFIGNAKQQLLHALRSLDLLSDQDIETAVKISRNESP